MPDHPFSPKVRQGFDPQVLDALDLDPNLEYERDEELRALVDALPTEERLVIEMHFWEGVSKREIARRLGMDRSAVNTLLRRAMRSLGEALHPSA